MRYLPHWALVGLCGRHYIWPLLPVGQQADVWNIACAVTTIALIWLVAVFSITYLSAPAWPTMLVTLWWTVEELLVAGCSVAYFFHPLLAVGDERCTAQVGVKLGVFGVFVVALLLFTLSPDNSVRSQSHKEHRE